MIEIKTPSSRDEQPEAARKPGHAPRRPGRAWLPAVLAAGLAACSAAPASPHRAAAVAPPAPLLPAHAGSLVRVPRPDYARPSSVAAAFFTAWASSDAGREQPGSYLARCAPLVTQALERQLASSQAAPAAWQAMRRARLVSLVQVQAVTRPAGAPAPTAAVVYLRVYATRVTTTRAGRRTASDGITVQLTRSGGRWLVSAILFY